MRPVATKNIDHFGKDIRGLTRNCSGRPHI